jgi:di/tricarboxylate transporter
MESFPLTFDQTAIFAILLALLGLLAWGRLRYDVVAFCALLAAVILGLVPSAEAFSGFGHPATVTVALVLILSKALAESGALAPLAKQLSEIKGGMTGKIAGLSGTGALLSAVMNNVGALGLLMPVAIKSAAKAKKPVGRLLMPLSFGCILGGLVTLIGTPPNIIVASYRGEALGEPFQMFDYSPVGGAVALAGLLFMAFIGWRLVPKRRSSEGESLFDLGDYLTEVVVTEESEGEGKTRRELEEMTREIGVEFAALLRQGRRQPRFAAYETLQQGDHMLIEAPPEEIERFLKATGFELAESKGKATELLESSEGEVMEAAIPPNSSLEGRTLGQLRLAGSYNIVPLGLARQGKPYRGRLRDLRLQAGDVLLLHGDRGRLAEGLQRLGLLPLAERGLSYGQQKSAPWIVAAFALAVLVASLGLLPITIAFGTAVGALVVSGQLPLRNLYNAIDWPVIVLLGALLPVGGALESSGATGVIVDAILAVTSDLPAVFVLLLVLVATMTLSDLLNNAATAVVMAPIAVTLAERLSVNPDAFLMAVALGASCAFLTPIGHQNNALILGPGGFRFSDYWRAGLPLEAVIVAVGLPMILLVWPL